MGFSPLANMGRRIPDVGRSVPRAAAVTGVGLHHNAGVDAYGQATAPGREVSANYWITNDGTILPNIDETRRAFTSGASDYPAGAAADHRNITVEVSNSPEGVRNGTWAISDAAWNALVRLVADVWKRYGLGLVTRGAERGLGVHQDWVPTACPGPYIMGRLGDLVAQANAVNQGTVPELEKMEDEMSKPMLAMKLDGGPMNTLGVLIEPDGSVIGLTGDQFGFWKDQAKIEPIYCKNPGHWEYLMSVIDARRARNGVKLAPADLDKLAETVRDALDGQAKLTAADVAEALQITVKQ